MKALKNCIKLSSQVKVYVPSTRNVNEEIENKLYVEETLKFLSSCFGGSTATKALGAWVSNKGDLVTESVTMVFSYARQEELDSNIERIYTYCLSLKEKLSQEAIALEVNGELYFV